MRISDLSRQCGVPVATIKFYLREQLLPPGTRMGRNQASYGEAHSRRLLAIRALTSVGQLDLTSVRSLVRAIEAVGDDGSSLSRLYLAIDEVLFPETQPLGDAVDDHRARTDVDRLVEAHGWSVSRDAPGRVRFAAVLVALRLLGCDEGIEFFDPYAEAAERVAHYELNAFSNPGNPPSPGVTVIRTILLNAAQSAIRRMAQEHVLATRPGGAHGELSNRQQTLAP
jgi:DNA-binding transcriptional MerR regulator